MDPINYKKPELIFEAGYPVFEVPNPLPKPQGPDKFILVSVNSRHTVENLEKFDTLIAGTCCEINAYCGENNCVDGTDHNKSQLV